MIRSRNRNLLFNLINTKNSINWEPTKHDHKPQSSIHTCQNVSSRAFQYVKTVAAKYEKIVHFNSCEIKMLMLLFQDINRGNLFSYMTEDTLKTFLIAQFDITGPLALEAICRSFRTNCRRKDINVEEFITGLSVFLRGSIKERALFSFRAFDIDGDGILRRREELNKFFQNSFDSKSEAVLSEIDPDEPIRETVNYIWNKFTDNNHNEINTELFTSQVSKNPIIMECLANLFPSDARNLTFQRMLFCRVYITSYLTTLSK